MAIEKHIALEFHPISIFTGFTPCEERIMIYLKKLTINSTIVTQEKIIGKLTNLTSM
jgi:hypothetical protein